MGSLTKVSAIVIFHNLQLINVFSFQLLACDKQGIPTPSDFLNLFTIFFKIIDGQASRQSIYHGT